MTIIKTQEDGYISCKIILLSSKIRYSYLMLVIVTTTCSFCLLHVYQLSHVPINTQNNINTYYIYTL